MCTVGDEHIWDRSEIGKNGGILVDALGVLGEVREELGDSWVIPFSEDVDENLPRPSVIVVSPTTGCHQQTAPNLLIKPKSNLKLERSQIVVCWSRISRRRLWPRG